MDVVVENNIPYDHSGNDLRKLGEIITAPAVKSANKYCAWNDNKDLKVASEAEASPTIPPQKAVKELPREHRILASAKSVMTDYQCNGWFKADQGSHVNCYYVHRYRTTARNARNICRENKAQLVTIDNIGEWSYVTNLAQTLAPIAKDRSLLLGYTRCSTDPLEWRTFDGVLPSTDLTFSNITERSDEACSLQLNIADKITYKPIQVQSRFYEGGSLQETICNKRVNYFICKRRAVSKNEL